MRRTLAALAALALAAPLAAQEQVCADHQFRAAWDDGLSAASRYRVMPPDSARSAHQAVDTGLNRSMEILTPARDSMGGNDIGFLIRHFCARWVTVGDSAALAVLQRQVDSLEAVIDSLRAGDPGPPPDPDPDPEPGTGMEVAVLAELAEGEAARPFWYLIHNYNGDGLTYICSTNGSLREAREEPDGTVTVISGGTTVVPPSPCAVTWALEDCEDPTEYVLAILPEATYGTIPCGGSAPGASFAELRRVP